MNTSTLLFGYLNSKHAKHPSWLGGPGTASRVKLPTRELWKLPKALREKWPGKAPESGPFEWDLWKKNNPNSKNKGFAVRNLYKKKEPSNMFTKKKERKQLVFLKWVPSRRAIPPTAHVYKKEGKETTGVFEVSSEQARHSSHSQDLKKTKRPRWLRLGRSTAEVVDWS